MPGTISPYPLHQWLTNAGAVAASHRLFTYLAGTTTKEPVYTDSALSVAHSNPITLNSAGRPTSGIYLDPAKSYKFTFAAAGSDDPPSSPIWTQDNIDAVPPASTSADVDVSGVAGETLAAGDCCFLSDGASGNTVGRWYKCDADTVAFSTGALKTGFANSALSTGSTGTFRTEGRMTGLSGLTSGSWYYISATAGALTSSAPTNARLVGQADSTTTLVVMNTGPHATASIPGLVSTGTQTIAGAKTFSGATTISGALTASSATAADFYVPPKFRPGTSSSTDAFASGRIFTDTTTVGNVGAGEDNLMSTTLTANSLSANGKAVRVLAWGQMAATASTKTLKCHLGSESITAYAATNASTLGQWWVQVMIVRVGAASQKVVVTLAGDSGSITQHSAIASFTRDETVANTLKFTGEDSAGTSDGVTQEGMIVEVVG